MTTEDLDGLVRELRATGGDTASVEVKSAAGGLPASISSTLSALANLPGGGLVILGGIRSIGRFTSFLVPFMIVGYIAASLVVLALNANEIPHALSLIFYHAFNPIAAGGGFAGAAVAAAIRYGVARGVFSNESGLGSAPIAAAAARTKDPVTQALVSMTQTFIDTLVVCTMTAMVILTSHAWLEGVAPGQLTSVSFGE